MDKYAILLGYFDKQLELINRLYNEILNEDVTIEDKRYVFALKTQQFYTAIEDLMKQIAKAFENHISDLAAYHKALLVRLNTEIPNIRPAVLSKQSFLMLDKIRAFRHFIRHAYDVELEENELEEIQTKLREEYSYVKKDLSKFRSYVEDLAGP